MLGSVPKSVNMLGRYLLNSANAGQMPAEFSERWADACSIQRMLGRRSREYLVKAITGDLYAEFSEYAQ